MLEGGLGADGVEVDEPGFEQRPRHGLQCLVHAPVQFNLVVQRPQDVCYCPLFGEGWDTNGKIANRPEGFSVRWVAEPLSKPLISCASNS